MTTWYDYMVRASEHAGSDGDLWFRYLYKVIKDEETKLTTDDVEQLLKNPTLTPFQKITLQDALTEGTHTREHVLQANRKSQPKDILKLFRGRSKYLGQNYVNTTSEETKQELEAKKQELLARLDASAIDIDVDVEEAQKPWE